MDRDLVHIVGVVAIFYVASKNIRGGWFTTLAAIGSIIYIICRLAINR